MSEIKRATLIPFGADKVDDKKQKAPVKSVRLTFVLPESNEGTCPVYNYKEELTTAKKKREKSKIANGKPATNGIDPFDEEDDDVKRIAMEMEAKYGTGPPTKKKNKGRRDDYADIGMGYDESDSFIDNTDGYDEIIPQNVTTLHGGFYINCGALEFKTDEGVSSDVSSSSSSSSSEDEDDDRKKASRKRVLETSESDGETETEEGGEKASHNDKKQKTNGLPVKKKKDVQSTLDSNNSINAPPKKPSIGSGDEIKKKTVKDLLKEKRDDPGTSNTDHDAKQSTIKNDKLDNVTSKENKKPLNQVDSLNDVIESVASGDNKQELLNKKLDKKDYVKSPMPLPFSDGENSRDSNFDKVDVVQLPENLPDNISELIKKIKENVKTNRDNSMKVFSGSVNSLLITFERKSKVLGKQSRSKIYQHLAPLMKSKKENLCRRAKNLVMEEDTRRLKHLMSELKTKVETSMSNLLAAFERESLRVAQLKETDTEDNKAPRMPKRKFLWTDETRKMLREIIMIKKRLLIYEGKTKETIEIHLNLFIKSDIQTIWPEGWMTMAALFKLTTNFEKKPGLNNSQSELNSSSEAPPSTSKDTKSYNSLPKQQQQHSQLKLAKPGISKEKDDLKTVVKEIPKAAPIHSSKDIHKLASNATLSITPITTSQEITKHKHTVQKGNDLTINKIDTEIVSLPMADLGHTSAVRISPVPSEKPKSTDTHSHTSQHSHKSTIQVRNTYKHHEMTVTIADKTTKFINLSQNEQVPENLTVKSSKMPTDHKIENIIKSNVHKHKTDSVKSRPSNEILIPKLETDTDILTTTKIPLENFMPLPMMDVKQEDGEDDVIVLDDSADDVSPQKMLTANDCKRKPGPKSKNKYFDAALIKPFKSASAVDVSRTKLLGNNKKDNFVQDSEKHYNLKKDDGDDIQQVMENLKVLQKMSTPTKSNESSPSSAVSVIAFNKNYTKTSSGNATSKGPEQSKSDYNMTFHDVYQRQFLNDNSISSTPTSSKTYNSAHCSSSSSQQDKIYASSNNNYTTAQNTLKYKSNYPAQQHAGSFNLMDDMLANFITEYAYPKTASHKQKPPQM